MSTALKETAKLCFTSEQRHVLGMLYSFLIQLGQQRLKRLEQGKPAEDSNQNESMEMPISEK